MQIELWPLVMQLGNHQAIKHLFIHTYIHIEVHGAACKSWYRDTSGY